jgi:hypothetical protein
MVTNAIDTSSSVSISFIVNKYDDIDGTTAAQSTPRGRLCFRDSDGRMVLPRTLAEAQKAVFPVDWHQPMNPGPYFAGVGWNGQTIYPFNDGSLGMQTTDFSLDPDQRYQTPFPVAILQYDVPLKMFGLPVASGNVCLAYDGGVYTYASGNYVGQITDFGLGTPVYVDYTTGNEGKITASGSAAGNTIVGFVERKEDFGTYTLTVKLKGRMALTS